jgi:hypothetical protein
MAAQCQEATYAPQQTALLLDHLVGQRDELLGNGQPERLGGLAVDYQLESGQQLGRARATQDLVHVGGNSVGAGFRRQFGAAGWQCHRFYIVWEYAIGAKRSPTAASAPPEDGACTAQGTRRFFIDRRLT